ncbi:MAG: hypothetical protein ACKO25_11695 [Cyanobium sp.]
MADGAFQLHVTFRDGEQQRSIRMECQRRTPEARVSSREEAQMAWF